VTFTLRHNISLAAKLLIYKGFGQPRGLVGAIDTPLKNPILKKVVLPP
jgi:hypothetical protein